MEAKFYKKPKKAAVINSNKQYDTYSKAFISLKFKNKEKNYKHLSNGTELSVLGFVVHEYELNTRCYKCVTKEGTEILIGNNGIKFTEEKEPEKYYMIKPQEGNKCQKTCAYVCVKSTDTNFSKGVHHKGKTTKKYHTPTAIDKGIEITKEEFLNEYNKAKQLKRKKGKLTIIVSKNYKELYEDDLALVNHILLDTVKNDKEWVEKVQKSNLNITLYTDKNDPELFKKSFGKFEVKLMDTEELTLENIQVDCSELTTEQIEEMKRVVVDNGYKLWDEEYAFEVWEICNHFRYDGTFCIIAKKYDFKTITYDKFMELFDAKKEECNNNLKGLVLVSHKGVDKSRLQESEYVKKMIKKGKILHAENFNKSLVMDNGSTISNVKEGEAKSIEELHVKHKEQNSIGKSYSKEDLFLSVESKPKQYQIGIDTFERAKANLTKEEYLACLKFGIDKYTWRLKGQDIEDFEKIIAYANEAINVLKSKK